MSDPDRPLPTRPLPELTPASAWFWTSGADGVLRIQGCDDCGTLVHPPVPICPRCRSRAWAPVAVSGRATVVGFTVNAHPWLPTLPPPYVIANVALEEDAGVRLTTNVVGCEPSDVHIGQEVAVRFEHHDDVWLPLFEPTGGPDALDRVPAPSVPAPRRALSQDRFEERAVLSGVGRSAIGRRLLVDPLSLTVDACLAAVADAGLQLEDIDGLSTYPGAGGMGMSEGGVSAVEDALRLHPTWINGGGDLPGPGGSVIAAMLAVASGLCRHVLCFRTVWESTFAALRLGGGGGGRASGWMQWRAPFGAMSAANWIGMNANQYLHRYGATREMLGWIAINGRTNAARNPVAIYRDPMTMDDYLRRAPSPRRSGSTTATSPAMRRSPSWCPTRRWPPTCRSRRSAWPRWARRSSSGRRGSRAPSPTSPRCSARARTSGPARTCDRPTSTSPSCTTGSPSTPSRGWRVSASAASARRRTGSTAAGGSRSTASCP